MEEKEILKSLGFTDSEVKVYLALLELGSASAGKICKRARITSSKIYEVLEKLIDKGLTSFVIRKRIKYFEASPPENISKIINKKKEEIEKQKELFNKILPKLKLKRNFQESRATIYKGFKGVETAFYDSLNLLKKGEEILVMGIPKRIKILDDFFVKFDLIAAKRGIKERRIVNEEAKDDLQHKPENLLLAKTKFVPQKTPAAINIFKNRILIFPESEEMILISIDNSEIAESFRVQFEEWWKSDTTVDKGFEAFEKSLLKLLSEIEKTGESYDVISAAFGVKGTEKKYLDFFKKIHKERLERGIKARLLLQEGTIAIADKNEYLKIDSEVKILPYKVEFPVAIFPYANSTLFVIQEKEPTIITINNEKISDSFKKHFESLWNQETRILKGLDSIEMIFEDMLRFGSCDLIGARGYFVDKRPDFIEGWKKRALKLGFKMRNIVDVGVRGHKITKFSFMKTKYNLPREFSDLSVFWIYGRKVVISNWVGEEPIVLIIENKRIYDMYKKQFEVLWKKR